MTKTILLTGATDGIGFETAKLLTATGHTLLLHGRSEEKLADTKVQLSKVQGAGELETYRADLSKLEDVEALAGAVSSKHINIDVLINNAGVFKVSNPTTDEGYDIRFIVNTIAPYLLTQKLLRHIPENGRIVNLSSAAQAPVDFGALAGEHTLSDSDAYAQSKLAITMWSAHIAAKSSGKGPSIIAVNPASFLGSKMVKEAYGTAGNDLSIGADILYKAALGDAFANASGRYYDNDSGQFTSPHPDASDPAKNANLVMALETVISRLRN
ncbi:MAG: SDR family NAD(P)-dependent oxidoreductase [Aquisalinus sp.]|nr:SDR family NAD(P)-dependent oxidoreductase [Aquisalinus sp.]